MPTQIKACFNGCSFTEGIGFPKEQRAEFIYDRIIAKKFNLLHTNIAQGGSSNYTIFMRSADAILSQRYDIIFNQWTVLNRIWLSPGPETYFFTNDIHYPEFNYRDIHLSKKEKQTFRDTLIMMNHDYQNIMDLVDYCKILANLAIKNSVKLVFINGIVPWQQDLTTPISNNLSATLSEYTKSILDFDHRDDDEIIKFFQKLQNKFTQLDLTLWVNTFESFFNNVVDTGPEGHHPGINSHQWMSDQVANYLTERKII